MASSPMLRWSVCEADYMSGYSAEVKDVWSRVSTPPYLLMSVNEEQGLDLNLSRV
jgi:hypothetical protein